MLRKLKTNPLNSLSARNEIKVLNKEIKKIYYLNKGNCIRRKILPGNSKSLWDAVKVAKDINLAYAIQWNPEYRTSKIQMQKSFDFRQIIGHFKPNPFEPN